MVGAARERLGSARADRLRGARRGGRAGLPRGALTLPVLVAPDSFKGTFGAPEVAGAIAAGLRSAGRDARELPVADGGEGTMDALVGALGGELREVTAPDPLGRPVEARFALLPDGSAVVETAQASGLGLVGEDERDAWAASTRGTGELIAAAAEAGAERVLVTVGGSATTDGGAGALEALAEAGAAPGARRALRRADALRARPERLRATEGRRPGDGRAPRGAARRSWPGASSATRAASR